MQFPADNKHRGSRNTVKHAERPIHETSVYKPSLPHCRCHRLEDPAEKAERKEQPQSLKSCIPHILYLSSPDFSFVFPGSIASFFASVPRNTVLRFFIPLFFHPASIKSRTCIQIFYHISSSYRICFFYFVFSKFSYLNKGISHRTPASNIPNKYAVDSPLFHDFLSYLSFSQGHLFFIHIPTPLPQSSSLSFFSLSPLFL